jgi:hypothetical protein
MPYYVRPVRSTMMTSLNRIALLFMLAAAAGAAFGFVVRY